MAPCNVSSDVLFEILSRVDLKTLRRCRILSRECNRLTYESSFMRLHCERTKTIAGYFIQSSRSNHYYSTFLSIDNPGLYPELSLDFLPARHLEILATVDQGLMFCVSEYPENRYYICKPSTQQWELIPSPNPRCFTRKVAMMVLRSDPLRFKIVRLSDGEYWDSEGGFNGYKSFHCEIFYSNIWAWKRLDDLILSNDEIFNSKPAISASGGLHWLTCSRNKTKILSFYEDKESWESVSLPDSLCNKDHCDSINLAVYEGKLALIYVRRDIDFVELWIMKDYYGERFWSKKQSLDLKAINNEIGHYSWADSFYNAETLLMLGLFSAIFYNFKNGEFHRLELELKHKYPQSAFFVQTNYEPIQLRQGRKGSTFSILKSLL